MIDAEVADRIFKSICPNEPNTKTMDDIYKNIPELERRGKIWKNIVDKIDAFGICIVCLSRDSCGYKYKVIGCPQFRMTDKLPDFGGN